ncbi:hypothetical protein [Bacillus alveayuensis]|uniref:hypothetical protein n=1 Tax=Aeribacillus alveayuensis TaxID=279215 RepID=UPI000AC28CD0|nr:hypothetical protein [Bacillus alveayuensis]
MTKITVISIFYVYHSDKAVNEQFVKLAELSSILQIVMYDEDVNVNFAGNKRKE